MGPFGPFEEMLAKRATRVYLGAQMKSAEQMLREMRMLEVAQELRRVFGAKLVAIRDNQGNVHGRCELLDEVELPPAQVQMQVETKVKPYRGKGR